MKKVWLLLICFIALANSSHAQSWTQVNTDGFGDKNNHTVGEANIVFENHLYIGTGAEDHATGAEIWRYDGTNWIQVNTDGFGNDQNESAACMSVYAGDLYVGTENFAQGAEVWRYHAGDWAKVNINGFSNKDNIRVASMAVYDGFLYAGTENTETGPEIWRYDGTNWIMVANRIIFGSEIDDDASSMAIFNGELYIGFEDDDEGTEVWKFNGTDWTQVADGFGDYNIECPTSMSVYHGYLYAALENEVTGTEIWRYDGLNWTQVNSDGFGNAKNENALLTADNNYLYISTVNLDSGSEIWRYDGIEWLPLTSKGFDGYAAALVIYNNDIYAGVWNDKHGCEVWKYSKKLPAITKFTAKAGKGASKDSISFSGTLDATEGDLLMADGNDITVVINANDMTEPMEFRFPINSTSFKKGKYNYARTENASQMFFKLDTKNGKMQFNAKNVDLTGLACPITVTITIGDYTAECDVNEDIVNGPKTPCPPQFLMHVKDTLTVSKVTVKRSKAPNMDSITVTGFFTIAGDYSKSNVFAVTLGANTYTIAGGQMSTKGSVEGCKKVSSNEGGLMTAKLDFSKCTFAITITNTTVDQGVTVPFGINVFGSELEGAEIDLLR